MPLLALTALLGLPFLGHPSPVQTYRRRIDGWTLTVAKDRFNGAQTCRLVSGGMSFERGALVLHLSKRTDTTAAVYRLDAGPPRRVADDAMELARQGFSLFNDDLDNPSEGLVRIPGRLLDGVVEARVQPRPAAAVVAFKLKGLDAARQAARAAGCADPAFR